MTLTSPSNIFKKVPLSHHKGIPIFSNDDRYVANYKKIALDHVSSIKPGSSNPFIGDELWQILENSTRALIRKYARHGDKVLDVGVGLGRVLGPLTEYERHGIDISLDYLEIAQTNGINVAFSKIEDMPYVEDVFDVIVVCDVLEHVLDLHQCCREILRVLKPGGTLIVRVPFKEDLTPYLSEELPYEFIHLRAFDEASLRLLFVKIFGMRFLEAAPVAPYLQGTPRLRVQLLKRSELSVLQDAISKFKPHLDPLNAIGGWSAEEFTAWIYDLRGVQPEVYQAVVDQLVMGIDINAVFKK